MELKDSNTLQNLKDAFAGESQANRRYLYFARQADIEGYPDVGGLFRDSAVVVIMYGRPLIESLPIFLGVYDVQENKSECVCLVRFSSVLLEQPL